MALLPGVANRTGTAPNLGGTRRCAGIHFASLENMDTPTRALMLALTLGLYACDDTGKAIKEEVKEVDTEEVKQDLKEAGRKVEEGAKEAAEETGKAIDKVDKKVAEQIRNND